LAASASSYNDRVAAIRSGTGGVPKLDAAGVHDDGLQEVLFGGPGMDWFHGQLPDLLLDFQPGEAIN
jgi:hypothetical protein